MRARAGIYTESRKARSIVKAGDADTGEHSPQSRPRVSPAPGGSCRADMTPNKSAILASMERNSRKCSLNGYSILSQKPRVIFLAVDASRISTGRSAAVRHSAILSRLDSHHPSVTPLSQLPEDSSPSPKGYTHHFKL